MRVDIIVDTICPWCYIGKARFERALAQRPAHVVDIGWRPFQLNPGMPAEGRDRDAYLAEKFGDSERAQKKYRSIEQASRRDAIDFRFDIIERTPNTVDSHRLILAAGRQGCQAEMVDALFRAYFTEGQDIGDIAVLAEIADRTGMDGAETFAYLARDDDRAQVIAEDEMARRLGVNGVPCYIVDRKYAISGAQSPEVFVQVFDLAQQDAVAELATG